MRHSSPLHVWADSGKGLSICKKAHAHHRAGRCTCSGAGRHGLWVVSGGAVMVVRGTKPTQRAPDRRATPNVSVTLPRSVASPLPWGSCTCGQGGSDEPTQLAWLAGMRWASQVLG